MRVHKAIHLPITFLVAALGFVSQPASGAPIADIRLLQPNSECLRVQGGVDSGILSLEQFAGPAPREVGTAYLTTENFSIIRNIATPGQTLGRIGFCQNYYLTKKIDLDSAKPSNTPEERIRISKRLAETQVIKGFLDVAAIAVSGGRALLDRAVPAIGNFINESILFIAEGGVTNLSQNQIQYLQALVLLGAVGAALATGGLTVATGLAIVGLGSVALFSGFLGQQISKLEEQLRDPPRFDFQAESTYSENSLSVVTGLGQFVDTYLVDVATTGLRLNESIQYQITAAERLQGALLYGELAAAEFQASQYASFRSDQDLLQTRFDGLLLALPDLLLANGYADSLVSLEESSRAREQLLGMVGMSSLAQDFVRSADLSLLTSDTSLLTQLGARSAAYTGRDPPSTAVPEPGTLALLVLGLTGLGLARRKRAA